MSEPLTAARERLIAFADRIEAGESPNESAGYEWEALVEDIRALSLDAARTPAMPRHLFSGEPGGPCTDICLLADDDPIHRALTNPVAPLDGLDEEDHRAEVEFERLGDAMDRAGYER